MVQGIEKFKEHFKGQAGKYVFIGGTACSLILEEQGIAFRATKDLDIVVLIEVLDEDFIDCFCSFIKQGNYKHINKSKGTEQFYRFDKPESADYPYMIELFSRKPEYIKNIDTYLAPLHVEGKDNIQSLSAILLDEEYYKLLKEGNTQINDITVLNVPYIILLKIRAWLDLTERKAKGESIDSKDIKKHKNDVFRLLGVVQPDEKVILNDKVEGDVSNFLHKIKDESINLKDLGIKGTTYEQMLELLKNVYLNEG